MPPATISTAAGPLQVPASSGPLRREVIGPSPTENYMGSPRPPKALLVPLLVPRIYCTNSSSFFSLQASLLQDPDIASDYVGSSHPAPPSEGWESLSANQLMVISPPHPQACLNPILGSVETSPLCPQMHTYVYISDSVISTVSS